MKKRLVNLENIKEFICENQFYREKNMIISPNVNDYLKINRIKVVNVEDKKEISLKERIEKLLKEEFNITNNLILEKVSAKVEEVIKNGY